MKGYQKSTSERTLLTQYKAARPSTEHINALVTETIELMRDISKLDMSSRKSVLVMGQTGVGKSTLMNLLAGVRLRGVEDARGDIRIENPDSETGFKIGHKVASETTIPNRWQNIDGDHISYWDCPGFLENRGEAQEIANALFIKKLFDTSQETKILIIIPHDDLKGKATNILSLINQLDYMFSGNISKIEGSISLIVSKSPPNKKASHVKEYLKKIIEEAPGLKDSKKSILEILSRSPISILKVPTEEGEIDPTGLMRADILRNINSLQYAEGLRVKISLSDHAKLMTTSSYAGLHKIIKENIQLFISDFKEIMQAFVAECKNKDELSYVALELKEIIGAQYLEEDEKSIQELIGILYSLFDEKINLDNVNNFSQLLSPADFLEQFIDEKSHVRLEILSSIKKISIESIKTLDASIANIEKEEKHAREMQAAEEARIRAETARKEADERARKAEEARKREEVARIAAEDKARKAEESRVREENARKEAEVRKAAEDPVKAEARKREEAARKVAEAARTEKDLQEFLRLLAEGEQDKAEVMLRANPALALIAGDVTDLSKRTFNKITGFQYAVWALDGHMWTMIRKYLPDYEAKKQAEGFETGSWVRQHGVNAQHLLDNLVNALRITIDVYKKANYALFFSFRDKKYAEANTAWVQQIGGAQLLLPAHVINEYCHPTRSFYPCPNFKDAVLPRTRKVDEGEWFTAVYDGGKLGEKWAGFRGGWWMGAAALSSGEGGDDGWGSLCGRDHDSVRALTSTRIAQREELINELLKPRSVQRKAA